MLDDDDIELNEEMSAIDLDDWDSVNNLNIVMATEQKFEIQFSTEEFSTFKCVGDLVDAISRKAATKA